MRKLFILVILFTLGLAACGQSGPQTGRQDVAGGLPQSNQTPATFETTAAPAETATAQPTEAATAAPAETAAAQPTADAAQPTAGAEAPPELVADAQQRLAAHLGVDASTLTLQSAGAQTWNDGAIGCPAPDIMYAQVIIEGYLLTFSDGSATYAVHTGETPPTFVLCDNRQPINLNTGAAAPSQEGEILPQEPLPDLPVAGDEVQLDDSNRPLVEKAQQMLSQELGVGVEDVALVKIESMMWNDSGLGCAEPDKAYMQVIVPGYQITLEAQGETYRYNTDMGSQVVRCKMLPMNP
jgi:pyruvate/2-oxoglutarate dehydrogenase complex dihydrolipoamide acyltransferase (E2) component